MIRPSLATCSIAVLIAMLPLAACDPVINIAGANFPAWLLCAIVGAILTAAFQPLFAATGIEPHLGPRLVIYPCLTVTLACIVYLIFFSRI